MTWANKITEHRERREAEKAASLAAQRPITRGVSFGPAAMSAPKPKVERAPSSKAAELRHKAALVELGCMACRRLFPYLPPGPVELHHLRTGGWGKGDYLSLIPLCVEHHRGDTGVHGLGVKAFPKRYGFDQADLLMDALTLVKAKETT